MLSELFKIMRKLFTISIVLFLISCSTEIKSPEKINPITPSKTAHSKNSNVPAYGDPYTLTMQLDSISPIEYVMVLNMDLQLGSYYVSPLSPGSFTGIFDIILNENTDITLDGTMSEFPLSTETTDPFQGDPVKFVTENTTHNQAITILNKQDFELTGKVQFTIEPLCTLEENWFTIASKDGQVTLFQKQR
jgi:hypothetical protein